MLYCNHYTCREIVSVKKSKSRCIGILTSGGDCPGLNAAIRGIAKTAFQQYGMKVIGIKDGFRGLVENRFIDLTDETVSGILTHGGTILGTSRDKPEKMVLGSKKMDLTDVAVENARRMQLDCLVCLGGGGTQKNALNLYQRGGLNVITLPKTIDNDVAMTDVSFGFHTALETATEAIDRLHTTATSHHRIIMCEVMGHNAGWLALGAGVAGGADVILIPEIPYELDCIADYVRERHRHGKRFSIIAIAEGALQRDDGRKTSGASPVPTKKSPKVPKKASIGISETIPGEEGEMVLIEEPTVSRVARKLQELTGTETRVTSLGHVLRGGVPSATDRILCTLLGAKTAEMCAEGVFNVMVAVRGEGTVPVPLEEIAGIRKVVPLDHDWLHAAQLTGTCMGAQL